MIPIMTSDNTSHYLLFTIQLNSNQFKDNLQSISTHKNKDNSRDFRPAKISENTEAC